MARPFTQRMIDAGVRPAGRCTDCGAALLPSESDPPVGLEVTMLCIGCMSQYGDEEYE